MGRNIHYKSLAWEILKALGSGAVLASMLVAPNMGATFKAGRRESRKERFGRERGEIQRALRRLRERRYVCFEIRNNASYLRITDQGRTYLKKFEFDSMAMPEEPSHWDKNWRIVLFDIPEDKRKERMIFRNKLADLGFHALQKSVFAYPYPCEDEIDFLINFLDIKRCVYFIESRGLGSADIKTRRFFNLPL